MPATPPRISVTIARCAARVQVGEHRARRVSACPAPCSAPHCSLATRRLLLLVIAEFSDLNEIRILTVTAKGVGVGGNHGYALLIIALVARGDGLRRLAAARGRPASPSPRSASAALLVVLLVDLPDVDATGLYGRDYEQARGAGGDRLLARDGRRDPAAGRRRAHRGARPSAPSGPTHSARLGRGGRGWRVSRLVRDRERRHRAGPELLRRALRLDLRRRRAVRTPSLPGGVHAATPAAVRTRSSQSTISSRSGTGDRAGWVGRGRPAGRWRANSIRSAAHVPRRPGLAVRASPGRDRLKRSAATSGSARRPCWPAPCGRCRPCACTRRPAGTARPSARWRGAAPSTSRGAGGRRA